MTTSKDKKHPCEDCKQCQHCAETRCHLCRGQGADAAERRFAALSMAQQIDLFEQVNAGLAQEGQYRPTDSAGAKLEPLIPLAALNRPAK